MEFDLIQRYFQRPFDALLKKHQAKVPVGIGDDCAALRVPDDQLLYVSTDTLVSGVHFFEDENPFWVGWKALACNLSDLAASGAEPLGFTLSISLPQADHVWLTGFSEGLLACAQQYECPLVGGDTTGTGRYAGLSVTIGVMGVAPKGHHGFHRSRAQQGDTVWVSGVPGLARLGLLLAFQARGQLTHFLSAEHIEPVSAVLQSVPIALAERAQQALQRPEPKLQLAKQLRGFAHAAIDLSDGLSGDVRHLSKGSGVEIHIYQEALAKLWLTVWPTVCQEHLNTLCDMACVGGDDFELCWTAPPGEDLREVLHGAGCLTQVIGHVHAVGASVMLKDSSGRVWPMGTNSYNHFSG